MRILLLAALLFSAQAFAHKPSDSYLAISVEGATVRGQWDIALRDLDSRSALTRTATARSPGASSKRNAGRSRLTLFSRLNIASDGKPCTLARAADFLVDDHSDGTYAVMRFQRRLRGSWGASRQRARRQSKSPTTCSSTSTPRTAGCCASSAGGAAQTGVLSPERPKLAFRAGESSPLAQFADYLREGVWHIWVGFDHILFLLSLLLPAVFTLMAGTWAPAAGFRTVFWTC